LIENPETGEEFIDYTPVLEGLPMGLLLFIISFHKYLLISVHPDIQYRNREILISILNILIQNELIVIYEDNRSCGYTIPGILELGKFKKENCITGFDGLEVNAKLFIELFGLN
jgi:hypothetical protein